MEGILDILTRKLLAQMLGGIPSLHVEVEPKTAGLVSPQSTTPLGARVPHSRRHAWQGNKIHVIIEVLCLLMCYGMITLHVITTFVTHTKPKLF